MSGLDDLLGGLAKGRRQRRRRPRGHARWAARRQQAGVSEDEAAAVLAKVLPQVVNGVSPNGRLPSNDELDQLVSKFGG